MQIDPAAEAREQEAFLNGALRDEVGLTSDDLQIGLGIAKQHMERGAYPQAFKLYATLVLCEPKTVDFQIGMANCALQMELNEIALQTASVVVALAPKDPRGYFLSGRACLALGLADEARQDLNDAIDYGQRARSAGVVEAARRLLAAMPASADGPAKGSPA